MTSTLPMPSHITVQYLVSGLPVVRGKGFLRFELIRLSSGVAVPQYCSALQVLGNKHVLMYNVNTRDVNNNTGTGHLIVVQVLALTVRTTHISHTAIVLRP